MTISCGRDAVAKRMFEQHMKIIQSGDMNKIKKWDSSMNTPEIGIVLEGFKKITYKINKVETKDKTATVNVTIKYPDYSTFENEFHNMITEKYKSSNIASKSESDKIFVQEATNSLMRK